MTEFFVQNLLVIIDHKIFPIFSFRYKKRFLDYNLKPNFFLVFLHQVSITGLTKQLKLKSDYCCAKLIGQLNNGQATSAQMEVKQKNRIESKQNSFVSQGCI